MPGYLAAFTMVILVGTVVTRVILMARAGIRAMHFGRLDKTDFLIPPLALLYLYTIFAAAFQLPSLDTQRLFQSTALAWVGAVFCLAGAVILLLSLIAFGRSFRVGIDVEHPDQLVTSGLFAYSRNPIYVAFGLVLFGQFLVFPNWIPLAYLIAGLWLLHRQVLREEAFLKQHYGQAYADYCQRVRRYL